jgi:hypothetical protein
VCAATSTIIRVLIRADRRSGPRKDGPTLADCRLVQATRATSVLVFCRFIIDGCDEDVFHRRHFSKTLPSPVRSRAVPKQRMAVTGYCGGGTFGFRESAPGWLAMGCKQWRTSEIFSKKCSKQP